jgi:lipoprotein-releasing system permease protein
MSRLPFELALALRYLRPKGTPVSIITLICVLGVMLGVAILIIVISVMTGFGDLLRAKVLGFNSHLKIEQFQGPLENWREVVQKVKAHPDVAGVAPYVLCQVLVETQPRDTRISPQAVGAVVRGVDSELESSVSIIPKNMVEGSFDLRPDAVLVGSVLARSLHLHVGDRIALYSVRQLKRMRESDKRGQSEVRPAAELDVTGIFDVGFNEYNATLLVTSLADAQDFQGLVLDDKDFVSGVHVNLKNYDERVTLRVADQLRKILPPELEVITWMEENQTLLGAVAVEKDMMYYLLFFIMIVAAFCIICSQLAFVMQKTREIGVLKSLGASRPQVITLFLAQSSAVGLSGVILGVLGGVVAVHYRNQFLGAMRRMTGRELFPAEIYNFSELPAAIVPGDLIVICGVSLIMCLVAGVVPAWIAASMKPVEALRHE